MPIKTEEMPYFPMSIETEDIYYISRYDFNGLGRMAETFAVYTFQTVLTPFWKFRKQIYYRKLRNDVWKHIEAYSIGMNDEGVKSFIEPITKRTMKIIAKQMRE